MKTFRQTLFFVLLIAAILAGFLLLRHYVIEPAVSDHPVSRR